MQIRLVDQPVRLSPNRASEHSHLLMLLPCIRQVMKILPTLKKLDGVSCIEWKQKMESGNEKQLREVFMKIDADGGGTLDQDELRAAVKDPEIAAYMKMEPVEIEVILFKILKTGAEEVTYEDFCYWFST